MERIRSRFIHGRVHEFGKRGGGARVTKRGDIYPHLYVDPPRWVEGEGVTSAWVFTIFYNTVKIYAGSVETCVP